MKRAASVALALLAFGWAWPVSAQTPALMGADPPACASYRDRLEAISQAGDINAYIQVAEAVPEACPKLHEMSRQAVAEIRHAEAMILRSQESTEQSYRPESSAIDQAIRGQTEADASAASAEPPDQPKDTHPVTEPPGSYDAPTNSGDQPPPR